MKKTLIVAAAFAASFALAYHEYDFGNNVEPTTLGQYAGDGGESKALTAVGVEAAQEANKSQSDVFIGYRAGARARNTRNNVGIGREALAATRELRNVVAIGGSYEFSGMKGVTNTTSINNGQIMVSETFDCAMLRTDPLAAPSNSPFAYMQGNTYFGGTGIVNFAASEICQNGRPAGMPKTLPDDALEQVVAIHTGEDLGSITLEYSEIDRRLVNWSVNPKVTAQKWKDLALRPDGGLVCLYDTGRYFTVTNIYNFFKDNDSLRQDILRTVFQQVDVRMGSNYAAFDVHPSAETVVPCNIAYNGYELNRDGNMISNYQCRITGIVVKDYADYNFYAAKDYNSNASYSSQSYLWLSLSFRLSTGLTLTPYSIHPWAATSLPWVLYLTPSSTIVQQSAKLRNFSARVEHIVDCESSQRRLATTRYVTEHCPFVMKREYNRIKVCDEAGNLIGYLDLSAQ